MGLIKRFGKSREDIPPPPPIEDHPDYRGRRRAPTIPSEKSNGDSKEKSNGDSKERRDAFGENLGKRIVPLAGLFLVVLLVYGVFKATSGSDAEVDLAPLRASDSHARVRACMATETLCPGTMRCRGAAGQLASAAAVTEDGDTCCTFRCENETIPVRVCKISETLCPPWTACRMGNTVTGVNAVTPTGESCCTFACNSTEPETRGCFASETLCPADSLCYGYTGSVGQPSAKNASGVCCSYSGERYPCTTN